MCYWTVQKYRNGKWLYVSGTDQYGNPIHTENKDWAWKFYNFDIAMSYFDLGYTILKNW